jgi:L-2-hydroxyglutarate oxidase
LTIHEGRNVALEGASLAPNGRLIDDFHIVQAYRMTHVLNAPSPAATASLSIGAHIARLASGNSARSPAESSA